MTRDEAQVVRFELRAMAARLRELGPLMAPPDFAEDMASKIGRVAALMGGVYNLGTETGLSEASYAPGYEPPNGVLLPPHGAEAWHIVDGYLPMKMTFAQRNWVCGIIAGTIIRCVDEVRAGEPVPKGGKDRPDRTVE